MSKKKSLKDLNVNIDPFGRLQRNMSIDDVNTFLNDKVDDKKLTESQKDQLKSKIKESQSSSEKAK